MDGPANVDTTGSGGSPGGFHNIDQLPLGKTLQISFGDRKKKSSRIGKLKKRRPK